MSLKTLSSKSHVRNGVPIIFEMAENILRNVRKKKCNIETILYTGGIRGIRFNKAHILAKKVFVHIKIIQNIIRRLKLCEIEPSLSQERAQIMVYKIAVNDSALPGNSKAALFMETYRKKIQELFFKLQRGDPLDFHLNENLIKYQKVCLQPQYTRIHTLSASVPNILKSLKRNGFKQIKYDRDTSLEKYKDLVLSLEKSQFLVDYHFEDLLVFSNDEDFKGLSLLKNKQLFIEDKASYIPVHVLDPEPGSTVLVACTAPGIQTVHLASMMKNNGKIYAFDADKEKCKALKELLALSGVENCDVHLSDFVNINPYQVPYSSVEYILFEQPCSASRMTPQTKELSDNKSKCKTKPSKCLTALLKHALSFPNVKRVVYSTSYVMEDENEFVVKRVYKTHKKKFRLVSAFPDWTVRGSASSEPGERFFRLSAEENLTNSAFVAVFERIQTADVSDTPTKSLLCEGAASKNKNYESDLNHVNGTSSFIERDQESNIVDLTNDSCEEVSFSNNACQPLVSKISAIVDNLKSKPRKLTDTGLRGNCQNSDVVNLNSKRKLKKRDCSDKMNKKCDFLSPNCEESNQKLHMSNDDLNSKNKKLCSNLEPQVIEISDSEQQVVEISDLSDEELRLKKNKSKIFINLENDENDSVSLIFDHVKKISSPLKLKNLRNGTLPQLQETRKGQYLLQTNSGVVNLSDWVKAEIKEHKILLGRHCNLKNHNLTTEPNNGFSTVKGTSNFKFTFDHVEEITSFPKPKMVRSDTLPKLREATSSPNSDSDAIEVIDVNKCNVKSKVKKKKKIKVFDQQPGLSKIKKNSVTNNCDIKPKVIKVPDLLCHDRSEVSEIPSYKCDSKIKNKKILNMKKCYVKSKIKKSKTPVCLQDGLSTSKKYNDFLHVRRTDSISKKKILK